MQTILDVLKKFINKPIKDVREVENLPVGMKKYVFSYPTIKYREITVRAKDLQSALKRADKVIKAPSSYRDKRSGFFKLLTIYVAHRKETLSNYGYEICSPEFKESNIGNIDVKPMRIDAERLTHAHYYHRPWGSNSVVEIPDKYWE